MAPQWKATLDAKLYQEYFPVPIDDVPIQVLEAVKDTKEEAIQAVFLELHLWHFGEPIDTDPDNNFHHYSDVEGFRRCCIQGMEPEIEDINGYIPKWKNLQFIASTLQVSKV
jgi:hypothetical protein